MVVLLAPCDLDVSMRNLLVKKTYKHAEFSNLPSVRCVLADAALVGSCCFYSRHRIARRGFGTRVDVDGERLFYFERAKRSK